MNRPLLRDAPLFICGHPKSGTSLLRGLLETHPELLVYPEESVFFRRFLPKSAGLSDKARLDLADQVLIHIFNWNPTAPPESQVGFPDRDYSAISFEQVRARFRSLLAKHPPRHPGDLLAAAVIAYGMTVGKYGEKVRRWVEKSPYNEYYADQIFNWWPDARCIHIVRDPRDNFLSYQRKHPDWTALFFAGNWMRSIEAGLRNLARYGADRCCIVRYKDLVQEPARVLRKICAFLEIEPFSAVPRPSRAGVAWTGNSMFGRNFKAVDAAPVGRWEQTPDRESVALISWTTRHLLDQLGYRKLESIPWSIRARGMAWTVKDAILRWRYREGPQLEVD